MQNFGGDKQRALWYVIVFSGAVNFADPTILEPGTGSSYPRLNPRLPITQDLTSQDCNENDTGPRFKIRKTNLT